MSTCNCNSDCDCGCIDPNEQLIFSVGEINKILAGSVIDCSSRYSCCPGQYRPLTLDEALPLVKEKERGPGKILTFLNKDKPPKVEVWLYQGQNITGWFDIEKNWTSLIVPGTAGKGNFIASSTIKEMEVVESAPSVKDNILYFEYEEMPEVATYGFNFLVSDTEINPQVPITVLVTLYTKLIGEKGVDRVRVLFGTSSKPQGSHVTASAADSEGNLHEFIDSGYWGPQYGFNLPVEYEVSTPFNVTFSMAGEYKLFVKLVQVDTGQILASATKSITVSK